MPRPVLTRLAGSINGAGTSWVIAALLVAVAGLASAIRTRRAAAALRA